MNKQTFQLKISPDKEMIAIALSAAKEYASRYIKDEKEVGRMVLALEEAIANVLNYSLTSSVDSIKIYAEAEGGELKFSVIDKGLPGDYSTMLKDEDSLGLTIMQKVTDRITIKNLGLKGRCQELVKYVSKMPDFEAEKKEEQQPELIVPKEINIIPMRRSDADCVARLFYKEYGFSYPNDIVYYPDRLYEASQSGSLHSLVAVNEEGRFLGHIAAFEWSDLPGVYETGMAAVDPVCRGSGVLNILMHEIDKYVRSCPNSKQNLGEAVVTHYYSQKSGYKTGSRGSGFAFCLTPPGAGVSTFREKGDEYVRQRDSYIYTPLVIDRSGKTVYSVPEINDVAGFVYNILDLERNVVVDDVPSELETSIGTSTTNNTYNFTRLVISDIGKDIAQRIRRDCFEAKKNGSAMIQLFVSMDRPGVYQAYEEAKKQGFFCAGLLPVTEKGDMLIMVNLFENTVDYENFKLYDPYYPLLEMIRKLDPDQR